MRVAIIPARGGSQRIPKKNIRDFHGKPIIAYSIETAKRSGMFDVVYVSTENADIAVVACKHGAEVIDRPRELAKDEVGTQIVMAHALSVIGCSRHACCIYATAPMLTSADLWRGLRQLLMSEADYAYCPGIFYWGKVSAFREGKPLDGRLVLLDGERGIDINTPADWTRAEQLYARLHEAAA